MIFFISKDYISSKKNCTARDHSNSRGVHRLHSGKKKPDNVYLQHY